MMYKWVVMRETLPTVPRVVLGEVEADNVREAQALARESYGAAVVVQSLASFKLSRDQPVPHELAPIRITREPKVYPRIPRTPPPKPKAKLSARDRRLALERARRLLAMGLQP
jgi:hypothetical protein